MTSTKPNFLAQFFRDIRERINQKVLKKFELPWMKSKELDIILEVLNKLKPEYCFEWGSGYSTVYFPQILPSMKAWYSIEHNEQWYKVIVEKVNDPRVSLTYIKPDKTPTKGTDGKYGLKMEGTYDEFKTYVDFAATLNRKFDFMFIDGRARKDCLRSAFDLISDRGVVIVHDANRENYLEDLPPFKQVVHFKDYRKRRGGILVVSKERDLTTVLDIANHRAAWKAHDVLAKVLFLR